MALLALPDELRQAIYKEVVTTTSPVHTWRPEASGPCLQILRVCRQCHDEAGQVFFEHNTFDVCHPVQARELRDRMNKGGHRIRSVRLLHTWPSVDHHFRYRPRGLETLIDSLVDFPDIRHVSLTLTWSSFCPEATIGPRRSECSAIRRELDDVTATVRRACAQIEPDSAGQVTLDEARSWGMCSRTLAVCRTIRCPLSCSAHAWLRQLYLVFSQDRPRRRDGVLE